MAKRRMMLALKEGEGWDFTGVRHPTKGAIVIYPGKIQKWKKTWSGGIRPIYGTPIIFEGKRKVYDERGHCENPFREQKGGILVPVNRSNLLAARKFNEGSLYSEESKKQILQTYDKLMKKYR